LGNTIRDANSLLERDSWRRRYGTRRNDCLSHSLEGIHKLLEHFQTPNLDSNTSHEQPEHLRSLLSLYRQARQRFTSDPEFEKQSKLEVYKLQNNDPVNLQLWRAMCDISRREFLSIYDLLKIDSRLMERGESFYNSSLSGIVKDLIEKKIASTHDGAVLIYESTLSEMIKTRTQQSQQQSQRQQQDKKKLKDVVSSHSALMIQKSDGAYLYGTTDIAAVHHRCFHEKADRVLYVTDLSQASHFKMVFTACQLADYVPSSLSSTTTTSGTRTTSLEHIGFGLVLGDDGKRLRSRSGETFPLRDLLHLSIESAREVIKKRHSSHQDPRAAVAAAAAAEEEEGTKKWTKIKIDHLAEVIGIGAVKYADLSMNRESGYKFSIEKMLSFDGNTAPYMLYAFVRVQGIYRKAKMNHPLSLTEEREKRIEILLTKEELSLALHLIKFSEILDDISRNLYPNRVSSLSLPSPSLPPPLPFLTLPPPLSLPGSSVIIYSNCHKNSISSTRSVPSCMPRARS
jgi:arginyl-tRNA synthetase